MKYEVTVVDLPARQVVGLCERISVANAMEKCPVLWEAFMSRHGEIANAVGDSAYGVSANMTENGHCDYWATLPVSSTDNIPPGMGCLTLRAGKYAKCARVDLASIGKAYEFLYGEWAQAQKEHPVDFTAACFEQYARDWNETSFDLYVPLS